MKDVSVNTKNLLYYLLLSWRVILLAGLICAILTNSYIIITSVKKQQNNQPVTPKGKLEELETNANEARMLLSVREINDVEAAIVTYRSLRSNYEEAEDYYNNSVIMKIDYRKTPTVSLRYYIDEHYTVEYPIIEKATYTGDIIIAYSYALLDEDTIQQVADSCGIMTEYAKEMITVYSSGRFLCIDIMGEDRLQCEKIADILKKRMKNIPQKVFSGFPSYDIDMYSESFIYKVDDSLYDKQIKKANEMNTIRSNCANIQTGMTDNQKKYFLAKMEYDDLVENGDYTDATLENQTADNQDDLSNNTFSIFSIKWFAVGFLSGVFVCCFVLAAVYVLNPVVRIKENITEGLHQIVLGTVWINNGKKRFLGFVDEYITKLFYGRECQYELNDRIEMLSTGIRIAMNKEGLNSVYITGASAKGNEIAEMIKDKLNNSVSVQCGKSIVYHQDSLQSLSESESVVFVEVARDSRYDEILQELECAKQSKVNVLGVVLIQS